MKPEGRLACHGAMKGLLASMALLLAALPAGAADLSLDLPVACRLRHDCWVIQYPDLDPGPGWRDHACGKRSYDGHNGTDIAIQDLAAMKRGVAVTAAVAGTVEAVRDGVPDGTMKDIQGRECGNAVRLSHPGGWQTLYCHLRQGSVAVRPGETVKAGQSLGLVGMSGAAAFPHLHLQVMKDGAWIDPFVGAPGESATCGGAEAPLWRAELRDTVLDTAPDIVNLGFSSGAPDPDKILAGDYDGRIGRDSDNLTLWARIYGVKAGDRVRLRLTAPDGTVLADSEAPVPADKIRVDLAIGRDKVGGRWPAGAYRGEVTVSRGGPLSRAEALLTVTP